MRRQIFLHLSYPTTVAMTASRCQYLVHGLEMSLGPCYQELVTFGGECHTALGVFKGLVLAFPGMF